jgi:hypothetical protein
MKTWLGMTFLRHFYYEEEVPWEKIAGELKVEVDLSVPIGYNFPQRWTAKLARTAWRFYPRLKDGRHMEVRIVEENGNAEAEVVDVERLKGTMHEPIFPGPKANELGIKRFIHRLGEIIVSAGGLHLKLLNGQTYPDERNRPDDPGPALSVYPGPMLGYCCLERDPHMHVRRQDAPYVREPKGEDRKDPVGWMVREMSTRAGELLTEAGYEEFVRTKLDQRAVAVGMREVEQAFRMPAPRYPGQWPIALK